MSNTILKELLIEYSKQKMLVERDAKLRKSEIYSKEPVLEEIDKKLHNFAISSAKSMINNPSEDTLIDLQNKKSKKIYFK